MLLLVEMLKGYNEVLLVQNECVPIKLILIICFKAEDHNPALNSTFIVMLKYDWYTKLVILDLPLPLCILEQINTVLKANRIHTKIANDISCNRADAIKHKDTIKACPTSYGNKLDLHWPPPWLCLPVWI